MRDILILRTYREISGDIEMKNRIYETATSATFYVAIYDRHTYAVVTSPQWSSNNQAGSAYDTVV